VATAFSVVCASARAVKRLELPEVEELHSKYTSIFEDGIPVIFETPFVIAAVALGWATKLEQFATCSVKEPERVKSARQVQSAPYAIKTAQVWLLDPLHRESYPAHVPDDGFVSLSQRQSEPVLFNRRHLAMRLFAQRESLPRQSPASGPVVMFLQRQSEPRPSNHMHRAWLLPAQRES